MAAVENFWWTVGGIVVAACITGLGWFVFTTATDVATLKTQMNAVTDDVHDMRGDLKDIRDYFGIQHQPPAKQPDK